MKNALRPFAVLPAAAAILLAAAPAAAAPTVAEGVLTATGTFGPGLSTTPAAQRLTLGGALSGNAEFVDATGTPTQANVAIADTCSLQGASASPETLAGGGGTISGTCTGTVSVSASGTYTRAGTQLVATGSAALNSFDFTQFQMICALQPASGAPVTAFTATCALHFG